MKEISQRNCPRSLLGRKTAFKARYPVLTTSHEPGNSEPFRRRPGTHLAQTRERMRMTPRMILILKRASSRARPHETLAQKTAKTVFTGFWSVLSGSAEKLFLLSLCSFWDHSDSSTFLLFFSLKVFSILKHGSTVYNKNVGGPFYEFFGTVRQKKLSKKLDTHLTHKVFWYQKLFVRPKVPLMICFGTVTLRRKKCLTFVLITASWNYWNFCARQTGSVDFELFSAC